MERRPLFRRGARENSPYNPPIPATPGLVGTGRLAVEPRGGPKPNPLRYEWNPYKKGLLCKIDMIIEYPVACICCWDSREFFIDNLAMGKSDPRRWVESKSQWELQQKAT